MARTRATGPRLSPLSIWKELVAESRETLLEAVVFFWEEWRGHGMLGLDGLQAGGRDLVAAGGVPKSKAIVRDPDNTAL